MKRYAWAIGVVLGSFCVPLPADFVMYAGPGNPPPSAFNLVTTNYGLLYGASVGQTPTVGTPAHEVFAGHVSFGGFSTMQLQENPLQSVSAHVLSRLNPNRRYEVIGTTIRSGFPDRWTRFELAEAQTFTNAHSANCLTSIQVPELTSAQVAMNTGDNASALTGDVLVWQDVQCSPQGQLVIYSRQYTGPVPGGSSAGSMAYPLAFLRVVEIGDAPGPVIIEQAPQNQTVFDGATVTFTVVAFASGPPVFYQWIKDGAAIPNATGNRLSLLAVTDVDEGAYSVVVSNAISAVTSPSAELQVESSAPILLSQPASRLFSAGEDFVFAVTVTGSLPMMYQWQFNGTNLPGATQRELILTNAQAEQTGEYRLIVTNPYGVAISSNATLTAFTVGAALNAPQLEWAEDYPWPYWHPQDEVTHDGLLALQSAALVGYQASVITTTVQGPCRVGWWWKLRSPNTMGFFRAEITGMRSVSLQQNTEWEYRSFYLSSNTYTLRWTLGNNGAPVGDAVTGYLDQFTYLPGGQPPTVVTPPGDQAVPAGADCTFRVTAEGHPPLRYQWQFNGVDVPDATSLVFTVHHADASATGTYTVVVSNDYGSDAANAALTVTDMRPTAVPQPTAYYVPPGGEVWLHARMIGSQPINYQWHYLGTPITGATQAVLKLTNVTSNQVGSYLVFAHNAFGGGVGPALRVYLTEVRHVLHISADGLAGIHLARGLHDDPGRLPRLRQLLAEGAGTLNARCDYASSVTVPNHLSMLTGRPVAQPEGQPDTVPHGYLLDSSPAGVTIHASGNTNVPYKASVFDVVHDHGLRTEFLAGKTSLSLCALSYNAEAGAPDPIPPDNGSNKIDFSHIGSSDALVDVVVSDLLSASPPHYTFLHLAEMDSAGHAYGWGTPEWFDALAELDTALGRILTTLETNTASSVRTQMVILLTSDHGGGSPATTHWDPTAPLNFTVPLLAWGPGFPAGADLHSRFANRADPATNYMDYNAVWQPLRNGDSGNLALQCLGLPPIPGSTLIPLAPATTPPGLRIELTPSEVRIAWSTAVVGFGLESGDNLDTAGPWSRITEGIQTNANAFMYSRPVGATPRFYRLRQGTETEP